MDAFFQEFLKFGLGGCTCGVVCWCLWHLLTRTLPGIQAEHRKEMAALQRESAADDALKRQDFLSAIAQQQATFVKTLSLVQENGTNIVNLLCERLEKMDDTLANLQREISGCRQHSQERENRETLTRVPFGFGPGHHPGSPGVRPGPDASPSPESVPDPRRIEETCD